MSWAELHQTSERLAAEAQGLALTAPDRARALYAEAAKAEAAALMEVKNDIAIDHRDETGCYGLL